MEFLFLGTGSAFCLKNYQSNAIINENGKNLLIDAGGDIRFALNDNGLSFYDIDALYISHLHNDHIGGIEYLALESYFAKPRHKIKLFVHDKLVDELWNNSLKGGLSVISEGNLLLNDYFEVNILERSFIWESINFNLIETIHSLDVLSVHPVFGLLIEPENGKKVYLTGDTRFVPEIIGDNYAKADYIIHDTETGIVKTEIHSHFDDLIKLDRSVKEKTYLWHYQDNVSGDFNNWQDKAIVNGFKGFIQKGQRLTF
jgi:ribonuclease BN (tRNA processing enzyme)